MADRFDDLVFHEIHKDHIQARCSIGKYKLSVIREPGKKFYEAAIFLDEEFVNLPGINNPKDDVIPYLDEAAVTGIMLKLHTLEIGN